MLPAPGSRLSPFAPGGSQHLPASGGSRQLPASGAFRQFQRLRPPISRRRPAAPGSWRHPPAPNRSRLLPAAPGSSWRLPVAPGCSATNLVHPLGLRSDAVSGSRQGSGVCSRPPAVPAAAPSRSRARPAAPGGSRLLPPPGLKQLAAQTRGAGTGRGCSRLLPAAAAAASAIKRWLSLLRLRRSGLRARRRPQPPATPTRLSVSLPIMRARLLLAAGCSSHPPQLPLPLRPQRG